MEPPSQSSPAGVKARPFNLAAVIAAMAVLDLVVLTGFFLLSYVQAEQATASYARIWRVTDGVFCIGLLYTLLVSGIYERSRLTNPYSQISRILVNATLLVVIEWTTLQILGGPDIQTKALSGPLNIISIGVLTICGLRLLVRNLLIAQATQGTFVRTVAIVGAGMHGTKLLEVLEQSKNPWTRIVGLYDDRKSRLPEIVAGRQIDGTIDDLIAKARELQIDDIMVALPWGAEERLLTILNQLKVIPANVHLAPDVIGHHFLNGGFSRLDGVPIYNVFSRPLGEWGGILKRVEDLVLGTAILIMVAPIMAVCAIAIKLDSPGPVLFRQRRYGYNNNLIGVFKFRSMYHHMRDENASKLATQNDPRITKVGNFLRRSSLDELPQLFNVLLGEMSLVGPRPHAVQAKAAGKLYQEVVREYAVRHRVKPGITGWAQVMGWRGETDTEEKIMKRVACDLYYMENWSLFLDIEILFRTVFAVTGKNAY